MKLTDDLRDRYSRMLALRDISEEDMESIMATSVAVVGAGGLGSPALRLLAAIGFGRILIVDRDIVELSNIQRQTVYNTRDIGRPKAEAAAENLELMNPNVEYEPVCASITERNATPILRGTDIIVDGLDTFQARRALNKASLALSVPYIFAGAVEYYANLSTFIPGETGCLSCVMGDAQDNPENTCANVGVSPTLLSIAASVQVDEALRIATGKTPHLQNRLMAIETATLSFEVFDIGRAEGCPECSSPQTLVSDSPSEITATLLCSKNYNVTPAEGEKLDLDSIRTNLDKSLAARGGKRALSVTFEDGSRVTLMQGGNAIVKGVASPDHAIRLYRRIVDSQD